MKAEVHDRINVQNNPVNLIDPDGLNPKDKHYGYPKKFWNWYHRNIKEPGDPDLSKGDAEKWHKEWEKQGKPGPDKKKKKKRRKGKGKRGLGLGITTVDAYCKSDPIGCAELMKELGMDGPDPCK